MFYHLCWLEGEIIRSAPDVSSLAMAGLHVPISLLIMAALHVMTSSGRMRLEFDTLVDFPIDEDCHLMLIMKERKSWII